MEARWSSWLKKMQKNQNKIKISEVKLEACGIWDI